MTMGPVGGRPGALCIDDEMVNGRELLGSLEITALLSGLCQPGPLGRLDEYRRKGGLWNVCISMEGLECYKRTPYSE